MKILVLGCRYSPNLGDGVICECVGRMVENLIPEAEVILADVLDRNSFEPGVEHPLSVLLKRKQHNILLELATRFLHRDKIYTRYQHRSRTNRKHVEEITEMEGIELVIFAGGQLFMDSYGLILADYLEAFNRRDIPVIFHAMGLGPSFSPKIQKRLADSLRLDCVKYISLRDHKDLFQCRYAMAGVDIPVEDTFDPALNCGYHYGIEKNPQADTIGLGMMFTNTVSIRRVTAFWVKLIRELNRQGRKWQIFVNGSMSDVALAHSVIRNLPELDGDPDSYMAPIPERPEELIACVANYRAIVSFRLHSLIIAASLGIPSIGMMWDDKLYAFMDKMGRRDYCEKVGARTKDILASLDSAIEQGYSLSHMDEQKATVNQRFQSALQVALDLEESNL